MKYDHQTLGPITHRFTVTVTPQEVSNYKDAVTKEFQKLEPQKAALSSPKSTKDIEKYFGPQIQQALPRFIMNKCFESILKEKNIFPISVVSFQNEPLLDDGEFKFWGQFESKPHLEKIQTAGITFQPMEAQVTEIQLNHAMELLLEPLTKYEVITPARPAILGDVVEVDFQGFIDNTPVPSTRGQRQRIELGTHVVLTELENAFIGMTTNETKEIIIDYPHQFHERQVAGKSVKFQIKLLSTRKKIVPIWSDELVEKKFSATPGNPKTLLEFRKLLHATLIEQEKLRLFALEKARVLKQLIAKNPFEAPICLIESQKAHLLQAERQQANLKGPYTPPEPHSARDIEFSNVASQMVRAYLLIEALAENNKITCTPIDIDNHLNLASRQSGVPLERLRKQCSSPESQNQIRYSILENKIMTLFESKPLKKSS